VISLPETDSVGLAEVFVALLAGFVEALEVLGAEFDGDALDVLGVIAPAGDGDLSEGLF
jgi:hypothetical protein